VKTQIVAKDQSTIVIGGLIQERTLRSVKKIPVLGSLPLIGWLFRDTDTTKQKTNLLVFLTPYIIRDESDYRRIYEKKRKEQQEFIEQFYGRSPRYEVDVDFARKAGPFAKMRLAVIEETSRLEYGGPGRPGERVITPGTQPEPPPGTQPGQPQPSAPGPGPTPAPPRAPRRDVPPMDDGTPVDRLDVQPDVPPPGGEAPLPPPGQPPPPAMGPATPPAGQ
jgi:general secretion pathway protein D